MNQCFADCKKILLKLWICCLYLSLLKILWLNITFKTMVIGTPGGMLLLQVSFMII